MELLDITEDFEIIILESKEEILNSKNYSKIILNLRKKDEPEQKFVVISKNNEYYVILFGIDYRHIDIVYMLDDKFYNEKFNFIGAGFMTSNLFFENSRKISGGLYFSSETCYKTFGYDQPKSKEEQNFIIENIEKLINDLFEIFS